MPASDDNPIWHEARAEFDESLTGFASRLSWTHYRTLLAVDDARARAFYEIEAEREGWPVLQHDRCVAEALVQVLRLKERPKGERMFRGKRRRK